MKKIINMVGVMLILGTLCINVPVYAELIVMKQTKEGFAPIGENDDHIDLEKMQKVLMACQWPMDISNEQKCVQAEEVLKPNNARIEERAAEKAIADCALYEKDNPQTPSFRVIFFPTCLYELFVIHEAYSQQDKDNPLQKAIGKVYQEYPGVWGRYEAGKITIEGFIASKDSPQEIRKKINDNYKKVNKLFIGGYESAYTYINDTLAGWLLSEYPDFKQSKDSAALSDAIQSKIEEIKTKLITRLKSVSESRLVLKYESRDSASRNYGKQLIKDLHYEPHNALISTCIRLEYEARELNKGLLIRGTSFQEFEQLEHGNDKKMIAGSTALQKQFKLEEEGTTTTKTLEQAYKEKETRPYSVSFGNSLFAGALRDRSASAYTFLTGERVYGSATEEPFKTVGYAVLINKKDYVEHQNSQLFFIPPLSPLASLFLSGEFFHARSKAAIAVKPEEAVSVKGVFSDIEDPTGVILITRDPLKHAALFSQFLAENGRIIQKGDPSKLTEEEKKFAESVLKTQKEAAGYYKGVQFITPKVDTLISKTRERLESKDAAQSK